MEKIEIRLLLVIGFCLGCVIGAILGCAIIVSTFNTLRIGIGLGMMFGAVVGAPMSILGTITILQARRRNELTRGSASDFFGGIAVGVVLVGGGVAIFLLGATMGVYLAIKAFAYVGITGDVKNFCSFLIAGGLGGFFVWVAWRVINMFFAGLKRALS